MTDLPEDATATVAQLHQRAADDYHNQQARPHEDHRDDADLHAPWRAA